jgi:outer membrane protein OmpA-like peptidoglycan-associated protein
MMRRIKIFSLCFLYLFAAFQHVQAQQNDSRAAKFHQKALAYYNAAVYDQAIIEVRKALKADPQYIESWLLLGDISNLKNDYATAIDAYSRAIVIDPAFFPPAFYILANLQFRENKYEEAIANYERFLALGVARPAESSRAEKNIQSARFRIYAIAHPVDYHPVNMGTAINSVGYDFVNYLSADGSALYFTRRIPNSRESDEDFYVSYRLGDTAWSAALPLGPPINTPGDEGALCLSPDGQLLFFAACSRPDGYGSCDLYYSTRQNNSWSEPKNLGSTVNSPSWESQPSFSPDGRTLYFVSNRSGGFGKSDIWITRLQDDGSWSAPENAGDKLNTAEDERSPFIHPDGATLYFSSKGWPGMGEGDIFVSRLDGNGNWSSPENIGYPVNTAADEMNLVVDNAGKYAYISSAAEGGFGLQDIYRFRLPEAARPLPVTYMKGVVFDSITGQKLSARFSLTDVDNNTVMVQSESNAQTGGFLLTIPANRNYALTVEKKGYLFYSARFRLQGIHDYTEPYFRDVPLKPIVKGEIATLNNIFFETDSARLLPESTAELNKLLQLLTSNPGLTIEISGHTDNTGTPAHNLALSEKRARAVYDFLIEHSIDSNRLSYKGYGENQPIAGNDTESGKAANRRTEFKVVEVK